MTIPGVTDFVKACVSWVALYMGMLVSSHADRDTLLRESLR